MVEIKHENYNTLTPVVKCLYLCAFHSITIVYGQLGFVLTKCEINIELQEMS